MPASEEFVVSWRVVGALDVAAGRLAEYDAYDETRADFSRWKGIYEAWRRRREAYRAQIQEREFAKVLRFQPAY